MAIIQNPIIGRARKQAGGMIFSTMYENNVMRARPISVRNPNTDAQKRQREFIADLTAYSKTLGVDDLLALYPRPVTGRSRYSELQKQLAVGRDVSGATGIVDISKVPKLGNGPSFFLGGPDLTFYPDNISLSWGSSRTAWSEPDAQMWALMINATSKRIVLVNLIVPVENGSADINYPLGWSDSHDIKVFITAKVVKYKPGGELADAIQ